VLYLHSIFFPYEGKIGRGWKNRGKQKIERSEAGKRGN
jgi:hypothetical protein